MSRFPCEGATSHPPTHPVLLWNMLFVAVCQHGWAFPCDSVFISYALDSPPNLSLPLSMHCPSIYHCIAHTRCSSHSPCTCCLHVLCVSACALCLWSTLTNGVSTCHLASLPHHSHATPCFLPCSLSLCLSLCPTAAGDFLVPCLDSLCQSLKDAMTDNYDPNHELAPSVK